MQATLPKNEHHSELETLRANGSHRQPIGGPSDSGEEWHRLDCPTPQLEYGGVEELRLELQKAGFGAKVLQPKGRKAFRGTRLKT